MDGVEEVCVVGAGPSGIYASHLLSKECDVQVFDRREKGELWNDCGWATGMRELEYYCDALGLESEDYVLHVSREIISDFFNNRDSITFNKRKFFSDVMDISGASFFLGKKVSGGDIPDCDLIVDATGNRFIMGNGGDEIVVPCYQLEVEGNGLPEDMYVDLYREGGYLWSFPLGERVYRVGAGLIGLNPRQEVEKFLSGRDYEVRENCSGNVRLSSPSHSGLYKRIDGTDVVAVGESAGVVCPLSGEGIAPAMHSAEILSETYEDRHEYESRMEEEFGWVSSQYEFIKSLSGGNILSKAYRMASMRVPDHLPGSVSKLNMFLRGW